jgi:hypothetical protein
MNRKRLIIASLIIFTLAIVWKSISYPAITLSIAVNLVASLLVILVFGKRIERVLRPGQSI